MSQVRPNNCFSCSISQSNEFVDTAIPCSPIVPQKLEWYSNWINQGLDSAHPLVNRAASMAASDVLRICEITPYAVGITEKLIVCTRRNTGPKHSGFYMKALTNCLSRLPEEAFDEKSGLTRQMIPALLDIVEHRGDDWGLAVLPLAVIGSTTAIVPFAVKSLAMLDECVCQLTSPLISKSAEVLSESDLSKVRPPSLLFA
jgi:hypothetical protein